MTSCANLLNQISFQLCTLKKKVDDASCALDVGTIVTSIFKHKDTVLNLVYDNEHTSRVCGLPVHVSRTECGNTTEYNGLLTLENTECESCVVVPASHLHKLGQRTSSGSFEFNQTLSVHVKKVHLKVLGEVNMQTIAAALQHVANCHKECETVSCGVYNATNAFLSSYNVSLNPYQVASFFSYLEKHKKHHDEDSHHDEDHNEPNEPNEPYEPSDCVPEIKIVSREAASSQLTSEPDIEAKLRLILENTDTTDN